MDLILLGIMATFKITPKLLKWFFLFEKPMTPEYGFIVMGIQIYKL